MEDPGGLYERMSITQFNRWIEYAQLEPFGEERNDWRAGLITSAIYNVNMDPRKGQQVDPSDFMPRFGRDDDGDDSDDEDEEWDSNIHDKDNDRDDGLTAEQWAKMKRELLMSVKG